MANEDWDKTVQRIQEVRLGAGAILDLFNFQIDNLPPEIADLTGLQSLDLGCTQMTDTGLTHIAGLTDLHDLHLKFSRITDTGLSHIAGLTGMKRLSIGRTQITDAGLPFIAGMTGLQHLDLSGTQITDLRPLLALPLLTEGPWEQLGVGIYLSGTPALDHAAIFHKDREEERKTLLAHLRTLPPWPEPLDTSQPRRGTTADTPPAIQTAQSQIAFLIEHAAISQTPASTTADQIRFALRDVPATDGNKLPAVLQTLADVATILDRIGSTVVKPDPKADLTRHIAALEKRVEDLVAQLADANAAKDAADALAKSDSFLSHYTPQLAKASANATVGAAAAIIVIGVPTTMHYFLGATNPLVESLFRAMRMKP
jgi:hypothetical protein